MKKIISIISVAMSVVLAGCSEIPSSNSVSVENKETSVLQTSEENIPDTYICTETDEICISNYNLPENSQTIGTVNNIQTQITTVESIQNTTQEMSITEAVTEPVATVMPVETITEVQTSVSLETSCTTTESISLVSESFTEVSHPSPNIYGYTPKYYQLNSQEQIVYNEIAKGLVQFSKDIPIPDGITEEQVKKIYLAVLTTIEQQMYVPVRNYTMMLSEDLNFVTSVQPDYKENLETAENLRVKIDEKANEIISKITPEMTKVDIIKLFHDSIILNCSYGQSDYSGSAYGALVEGVAQCEGYSRAMTYLCKKMSIPCEIITGTSNGSAHMWNMIETDGKWYHIDVTWDDPILVNDVQDYISYKYFNLDDTVISETHKTDENFLYPVAYSSDAGYFVYYKLFIDNSENANQIIKDGISSSIISGKTSVSFKFDNSEIYNEISENLFNNAWENFFIIIDECNSENGLNIDKNNIRVRKDVNNLIVEMSF